MMIQGNCRIRIGVRRLITGSSLIPASLVIASDSIALAEHAGWAFAIGIIAVVGQIYAELSHSRATTRCADCGSELLDAPDRRERHGIHLPVES